MKDPLTPQERATWVGFVELQGRLFGLIETDLNDNSGLTHTEYEVILRLAAAPDKRLRIQYLASVSLLSRSGTSRAVDRLAKAGLVRRETAQEDGRGAYAVLTEAGEARFRAAEAHHLALVKAQFLDRLTVTEQEQLRLIWKKLGVL
jgi:DNA-binding MarR family transcriptional regulator